MNSRKKFIIVVLVEKAFAINVQITEGLFLREDGILMKLLGFVKVVMELN